jgi:lysyl-tRNA synthetase class 2
MSDNLQSGLIGQREMRLAKLKKMIELGIDPFPAKTNKEKGVGEVLASFEDYTDKQVITAGRLISWRRHGQIAFGHLRDSTGEMQIFLQSAMLGEADVKKGELNYEQIKELVDLGDFLEVKGKTVLTILERNRSQSKA